MTKPFSITIDGPAGAGKTSTAKAMAKRLGFRYVDTGGIYRLIAAYRTRDGSEGWLETAKDVLRVSAGPDGTQVMSIVTDGRAEPVPEAELRSPGTSERASVLSTDPAVRALANRLIREYAGGLDTVMEGRDTGTAVMPEADLKFYLSASLDARAGRRYAELAAAGADTTPERVRDDTARRDARDSSREADPLACPEGAVRVDNTGMDPEECLSSMLRVAYARIAERRATVSGLPEPATAAASAIAALVRLAMAVDGLSGMGLEPDDRKDAPAGHVGSALWDAMACVQDAVIASVPELAGRPREDALATVDDAVSAVARDCPADEPLPGAHELYRRFLAAVGPA